MTAAFMGLQAVGAVELDLDNERMCTWVSHSLQPMANQNRSLYQEGCKTSCKQYDDLLYWYESR
jgi:hypothetical protein